MNMGQMILSLYELASEGTKTGQRTWKPFRGKGKRGKKIIWEDRFLCKSMHHVCCKTNTKPALISKEAY